MFYMGQTRILVVEDEGIVGLEIQNRLTNMGYTVTDVVATGEGAIDRATLDQPDLILMDIRLKGAVDGVDAAELQAYFIKSLRYTAGVATHYAPATVLTAPATYQNLANGFTIGMRFHSAPVIRAADAKPMHLGHVARPDGAWRIYAFADAGEKALHALADFLAESPKSPVLRFTPPGADIDSVIDVRAVFQRYHRDIAIDRLPSALLPRKGRFGLVDYEKAFAPDLKHGPDIFDARGIKRKVARGIRVKGAGPAAEGERRSARPRHPSARARWRMESGDEVADPPGPAGTDR